MHSELHSEGLKHLSSILAKAQGITDRETHLDIDVGREVQRLRVILDKMNAALPPPVASVPQGVEEFIAAKSQPRDCWVDGVFRCDSVMPASDLRTWMSGHARAPVDTEQDTERLDFIIANISGKALRDMGIVYGAGRASIRDAIDNAILAASQGEV